MKNLKKGGYIKFLFGILFVFTVFLVPGLRGKASVTTNDDITHVYDDAGLLTSDENSSLESQCKEYGDNANLDIIILTHDDSDAEDADLYIENFYDKNSFDSCVILLVDMYNRDVAIQAYGDAQTYIHSKRIDSIIDSITDDLTNENYYNAFEEYITRSANYMGDDSVINTDHDYSYDSYDNTNKEDSILTKLWFQILISLVVGAIVVGIMAYNAGGKMTASGNTYIDNNHSGLIGRRDLYIRTKVTRVKKPTNNDGKGGFNASGFRGGFSAGGSSHSSGRGKF